MKLGYTFYTINNINEVIELKVEEIVELDGETQYASKNEFYKRKDIYTSPKKAFNVAKARDIYNLRLKHKRLEEEMINKEVEDMVNWLKELLLGKKVNAKKYLNHKLDYYDLKIQNVSNHYGQRKFYLIAGDHIYNFKSFGKLFLMLEEDVWDKVVDYLESKGIKIWKGH